MRYFTILLQPTFQILFINIPPQDGDTALLCAGENGHLEVVQLLLGAGARDIPNNVK